MKDLCGKAKCPIDAFLVHTSFFLRGHFTNIFTFIHVLKSSKR